MFDALLGEQIVQERLKKIEWRALTTKRELSSGTIGSAREVCGPDMAFSRSSPWCERHSPKLSLT
jgi:hypothetical protein